MEDRAPYGGGRVSPQRAAIAASVAGCDGAFTVDELTERARGIDPGIGTATVYRAVAAMVAAKHLDTVGERDGRTLFALCGEDGHHHHAVCTSCGRVEATGCELGAVAPAGFTITSHDVTLYGLCASCSDGGG